MRYTREIIVLYQRQIKTRQLLLAPESVLDKVLMENELYQVEVSLAALGKSIQ